MLCSGGTDLNILPFAFCLWIKLARLRCYARSDARPSTPLQTSSNCQNAWTHSNLLENWNESLLPSLPCRYHKNSWRLRNCKNKIPKLTLIPTQASWLSVLWIAIWRDENSLVVKAINFITQRSTQTTQKRWIPINDKCNSPSPTSFRYKYDNIWSIDDFSARHNLAPWHTISKALLWKSYKPTKYVSPKATDHYHSSDSWTQA